MTDTDQNQEDEVLKRMLRTPHKKHEPTTPLGKRRRAKKNGAGPKADPAEATPRA
jgi:hypothetical protein